MTYADRLIVIVITFYSPSCPGQETADGPFGLRVKLPPAQLFTTHGRDFILSLLMLNVKLGSCKYQFFYSFWFSLTWNRTQVYRFSSKRSIHSTTKRSFDFMSHILIRISCLERAHGNEEMYKKLKEKHLALVKDHADLLRKVSQS